MGIASDRAKAQRPVDFSATDAQANRDNILSPAEIGRASAQRQRRENSPDRGHSRRGTLPTAPRELNSAPSGSQRFAAADATYETSAQWRIGAAASRAAVIVPPPSKHGAADASRRTPPRAADGRGMSVPSSSRVNLADGPKEAWNGESLRYSKRQAAAVRVQSSGRARRAMLEQRRAEGLSSSRYTTIASKFDDSNSGLYQIRASSDDGHRHHGNDAAAADTMGSDRGRGEDTTCANGGSARHPHTAGWTIPAGPRFPTDALHPVAEPTHLPPPPVKPVAPDVAVRRHVPGPTMRVQMAARVFEEHRAARASSARGLRRPPSDFDSRRHHPLPNLRGCVHSRLAPASAIH
jgi:hypothetical protein